MITLYLFIMQLSPYDWSTLRYSEKSYLQSSVDLNGSRYDRNSKGDTRFYSVSGNQCTLFKASRPGQITRIWMTQGDSGISSLESLDLMEVNHLKTANIFHNLIGAIDLPFDSDLTFLNIQNNQIQSLAWSDNIEVLKASKNQLNHVFNINLNSNIQYIDVSQNPFSGLRPFLEQSFFMNSPSHVLNISDTDTSWECELVFSLRDKAQSSGALFLDSNLSLGFENWPQIRTVLSWLPDFSVCPKLKNEQGKD